MQFWTEVRRRVLAEKLSKRAACEAYGLGWQTLNKILTHEEPPGYRQQRRRKKPRLDPFLPILEQILIEDLQAPLGGTERRTSCDDRGRYEEELMPSKVELPSHQLEGIRAL